MPAAKFKSRKRKRHHLTSSSSSNSTRSDSANSSPEKRRPKKQKTAYTNSCEANLDAEAQLLLQQQQTLKLTKQQRPSKDTERLHVPRHSTGDQSLTGDIPRQIDLEEDVDCRTAPKILESLAKRNESKRQTKLTVDQFKEKSKNLLVRENCP